MLPVSIFHNIFSKRERGEKGERGERGERLYDYLFLSSTLASSKDQKLTPTTT
jgi:hypothetical protein